MAVIINHRDLSRTKTASLPSPIILCRQDPSDFDEAVSLNVPLAKELTAVKPNRRTLRLEQCFRQVLDTLPENPVIRDFDVLFNPEYKVDILRIMASVGKNKAFRVVWPGRYENNRLIYAEEGYLDYKVYDLDKYDVTCVI